MRDKAEDLKKLIKDDKMALCKYWYTHVEGSIAETYNSVKTSTVARKV